MRPLPVFQINGLLLQLGGTVDIRLTQPRTIVRWVMDHTGAGGNLSDDGKMNTELRPLLQGQKPVSGN